ncbi:MAG: universal stress protein [Crenarchaeota archaeon]|nr:universal stress protein [Thermoproteota archaeon]
MPGARFETALVAFDLSAVSDIMVRWLPGLRRLGTRRLILFHAIPPTEVEEAIERLYTTIAEEVKRSLRESALGKLRRYAEELQRAGFEVEVAEPVFEDPTRAILGAAERYQADFIVLGSHGRRWLSYLLLGSVAEEVIMRSTRPVLVMRPAKEDGRLILPPDPLRGPLVAVFHSGAPARGLAECLLTVAARAKVETIVIYVHEDEAAEPGEEVLQTLERLRGEGVEVRYRVAGDDPKAVLRSAEEARATLIILPSPRDSAAPFVDTVVRHSKTHILVCP